MTLMPSALFLTVLHTMRSRTPSFHFFLIYGDHFFYIDRNGRDGYFNNGSPAGTVLSTYLETEIHKTT